MDIKSFEELLEGYINNNLSKQELDHFLEIIRNQRNVETVQEAIESLLINTPSASIMDQHKADILFGNIMEAARKGETLEGEELMEPRRRSRFSYLKYAIAASLIGITVLIFVLGHNKNKYPRLASSGISRLPYKNDVLPGGEKAILKLADGSTIILDDAKNGALAHQGNTEVVKLNGKLNYRAKGLAGKIVYNTLSTPRGGKYQVQLPDGSQVWLNSGSSLYFPTAFAGKQRVIELKGEAYFEIAKNKKMPFIVKVHDAEVQVLGTHFDVMAYHEEGVVKTSLLEGSVKFVSKKHNSILKPGQQSLLTKDGQVKVLDNINTEEVLSWKSGVFHFNGADVETVMRQLSRWYDIDVVYKNRPTEHFYAKIPTNTKLSDVLMALELTGKVHFQIEGKKVIVML